MKIPVNTWFSGTELLWDGGVWIYRAIGNGIPACKTSLRPELHPPAVFWGVSEQGPSQGVRNLEFLFGKASLYFLHVSKTFFLLRAR